MLADEYCFFCPAGTLADDKCVGDLVQHVHFQFGHLKKIAAFYIFLQEKLLKEA